MSTRNNPEQSRLQQGLKFNYIISKNKIRINTKFHKQQEEHTKTVNLYKKCTLKYDCNFVFYTRFP